MKITDIWQIKILRKLNKINIDDDTLFFVLTLLVGVLAGGTAVLIAKSSEWLAHLMRTHESPTLMSVIASLTFVFISGYISTRIAPGTSGSGIPLTKIHYTVNHGLIKFKEWSLKLITTILSLSSGITLGREGPTVAVTSGIGSSIGQFFSLSKTKIKTLLAAGSAAGIAGAFNTPIAAVMFTLEEIVGDMNAKALGPIIVSSVAAAVTSKVLTGGHSTFSVLKYNFEDPIDLVFYLCVGLLTAFVGPLWVKTIVKFRHFRLTIFMGHRLTYIMTTMILLLIFAAFDHDILGSGHHILNEALLSHLTDIKSIVYLLVFKFIFISLCFSSGISGGVFMPTLFMGAMLGSIIGITAKSFFLIDSQIGAFALVGMGAFFAAVIRAPITSILIIFEMTQDYKIILPLMIANITSYMLSGKIIKGSIYEKISEQDGIHLPTKDDHDILEKLTVEEAMIWDVFSLNNNLTVRESLYKISTTNITGFPVLRKNRLIGVVSKNQIATEFASQKGHLFLEEICSQELITIHPDQSLLMALHYLERFKVSRLIVTSRLDEKLVVGVITAKDIVEKFGFHIQEDNKHEKINDIVREMQSELDHKTQE